MPKSNPAAQETASTDIVLVKLGGSLITDKETPETPRLETLARLASEIARALPNLPEKLVIGHGSGSFGHVAAARFGLDGEARSAAELPGVSFTQGQALELHRLVVGALRDAGVLAFSIAPSSAAVAAGGRPVSFELEPLTLALERGLVPVVFGDVVMDRLLGATICSTETLFTHLASHLPGRGLRVRRLLWLGITDGLYDARGETVPSVAVGAPEEALAAAGAATGTDVTGGMAHRLETALALASRGVPSWILNGTVPGLLERALAGEEVPGTRVFGS